LDRALVCRTGIVIIVIIGIDVVPADIGAVREIVVEMDLVKYGELEWRFLV